MRLDALSIASRLAEVRALLAAGDRLSALHMLAAMVRSGEGSEEVLDLYRRLDEGLRRREVPHADVFNAIYESDFWSGGSGPGSHPRATKSYRAFLSGFLKARKIRSVVDVGCGDWQSSRLIDWTGISYLGIDVSALAIERASKYATAGIKFVPADARTFDLPGADLLIVKDVLQHWSTDDIVAFVPKLAGFQYCLISNGIDRAARPHEVNANIAAGGFRPVDLSRAPFSLLATEVHTSLVSYMPRQGTKTDVDVRTVLIEGSRLRRSAT